MILYSRDFDYDRNLPVLLVEIARAYCPFVAPFVELFATWVNENISNETVFFGTVLFIVMPNMTSRDPRTRLLAPIPFCLYGMNAMSMLLDAKIVRGDDHEIIETGDQYLVVDVNNGPLELVVYFTIVVMFYIVMYKLLYPGVEGCVSTSYTYIASLIWNAFWMVVAPKYRGAYALSEFGMHNFLTLISICFGIVYFFASLVNFCKRYCDKTGLALVCGGMIYTFAQFLRSIDANEGLYSLFIISTALLMFKTDKIKENCHEFFWPEEVAERERERREFYGITRINR